MEYKNEHITTLENAAREVSLSHAERVYIKEQVRAYMLAHPARTGVFARLLSYEVASFKLHPIALSLLVVISTSAGTAFAAENTLPGDALYPVKVGVTEPLQKIIARTPDAKAHVAQVQTERRLEEAELLAAEGRLTPQVSEEIATRLGTHVSEFETEMKSTSEPTLALGVRADFEASLEAHADVLEHIAETVGDEREALGSVVAVARERAGRSAERRVLFQEQIRDEDLSRVATVRKEDARRKLALVQTAPASQDSRERTEVMAEARSFMATMSVEPETPEETYARGESEYEKKSFAPAYVAFDEVARKSERERVRRERQEKIQPLLAKHSGSKDSSREEVKKEEHENEDSKASDVPSMPAVAAVENVSSSTTIVSATATPSAAAATFAPATTTPLYPHEEEKEDR